MAVSFVNITSSQGNEIPLSLSYTPDDEINGVMVWLFVPTYYVDHISGVDFGGSEMSEYRRGQLGVMTHLHYHLLGDVPTGAQTVTVNGSGGGEHPFTVACLGFIASTIEDVEIIGADSNVFIDEEPEYFQISDGLIMAVYVRTNEDRTYVGAALKKPMASPTQKRMESDLMGRILAAPHVWQRPPGFRHLTD